MKAKRTVVAPPIPPITDARRAALAERKRRARARYLRRYARGARR